MQRQIAREQVIGTHWPGDPEFGNAVRLAQLMRAESVRIVLAESCTAGGVALTLGTLPNISEHLCGSAVVYRDQEKVDWLKLSNVGIQQWTSACAPVAALMAFNVLRKTTDADYSASVTGRIGTTTSRGLEGVVFIGTAWRDQGEVRLYRVERVRLMEQNRISRIREAANFVLMKLAACILSTCRARSPYPEKLSKATTSVESLDATVCSGRCQIS